MEDIELPFLLQHEFYHVRITGNRNIQIHQKDVHVQEKESDPSEAKKTSLQHDQNLQTNDRPKDHTRLRDFKH